MKDLAKLDISKIRLGVCFSEPVYFEDGKNMFLAAGKTAKAYHVAALKQWKIPYLLTNGKEINPYDYGPSKGSDSAEKSDADVSEIEEL